MISPQVIAECDCPHPRLCLFQRCCQMEDTSHIILTPAAAFEIGRQSVLQELVDARHTTCTNDRLRAKAQKGPLTLVWVDEADWADAQIKRAARLPITKEDT